VLALLGFLLVLLVHGRDLRRTFDAGFEGYQGSFFAIAAVNYERFGLAAHGGYPTLLIDTQSPPTDSERALAERLVYANHPPLVPLMAWASARLFGPAGWSEAWRAHAPPRGLELALRLPFFGAFLLVVVLAFLLTRTVAGTGTSAAVALTLAFLPSSRQYAALVNYEWPALAAIGGACLATVHYARGGRRAALAGIALAMFAGGLLTWSPLFYVPGLVVLGWAFGDRRRALHSGAAALLGVGLPLVLHSTWSARWGPAGASAWERARELLAPVCEEGNGPLAWLAVQTRVARELFGDPLLLLALAGGLALVAAHILRDADRRGRGALLVALGCGALLQHLAHYRHTLEGQETFILYFALPLALCAALPLQFIESRTKSRTLREVLRALGVGVLLLALLGPSGRPPAQVPPGSRAPSGTHLGSALRGHCSPPAVVFHPRTAALNLAPAYYAWRNALAADSLAELAQLRAHWRWPDEWSVCFLLPESASAAALRAELAGRGASRQPLSAGWELWTLPR